MSNPLCDSWSSRKEEQKARGTLNVKAVHSTRGKSGDVPGRAQRQRTFQGIGGACSHASQSGEGLGPKAAQAKAAAESVEDVKQKAIKRQEDIDRLQAVMRCLA